MRLRDHHKGDLALTGLTLALGVAAAASSAVRWVSRRQRPRRHVALVGPRSSTDQVAPARGDTSSSP